MKYIDADRLLAFKEALADTIVSAQGLPTYEDCKERADAETDVLLATLFPLQQDQPEVNLNADIEMEWDSFIKHSAKYDEESEDVIWLNYNSFNDIAHYFYELGLNARKEENK